MSGVVTVTLAPAIDQTYRLRSLAVGSVNRADAVSTELSGKGVNVARAIALSSTPVSAVLPLGADAQVLAADPSFAGVLAAVETAEHTRVNTTLIDESGETTKVNENPVPITPAVWEDVIQRTVDEVRRLTADWVIIAGSVPHLARRGGAERGDEVDLVGLLRTVHALGALVAVDTAGAALSTVARHLDLVDLIKPNTHELAELTGRPLSTIGDVVFAANELRSAGCGIVYVSMGADGALAVSEGGVWHARVEATVVNTAGAGDASLAGFVVGAGASRNLLELDVAAAVEAAAAWGAHAVVQPTTLLTSLAGVPTSISVVDPDGATPLTEPAQL